MPRSVQGSSSRKILIIAGEASGDLQASLLLEQLGRLRPSWSFFGIGGAAMVRQGLRQTYDVAEMAVIGFAGVVRKFFFFRRVFNEMLKIMEEQRPDAVILVDYPGFNLRFSCCARERGFRVLYYIAPQVWAWGENRVRKLRRCVDQLIVVFPFEDEYFSQRGVNVRRVGHPLLDIVKPSLLRDEYRSRVGVPSTARLITLMPGSRSGEVERHLPVMLAAVGLLAREGVPVISLIVRAPEIPRQQLERIAARAGTPKAAVDEDGYSAIAAADLALVKSGTATVECAILGRPMVVMYKTGAINYHIARRLIKTKHLAMVNLIAGRAIVPEFIQQAATPENLARAAGKLLADGQYRSFVESELGRVRQKLGPPGGASRAAEIVVDWLEKAT